jgi:PAS domain-containing protein
VIRSIGVIRDITERKRGGGGPASDRTSGFGRWWRTPRSGSGRWMPRGLYTYVSPVVERIIGYRPEEMVGRMHFYDHFHPSDCDA